MRFVAPDGDDGAAGSRRDPWRTLAHAVGTAPVGGTVRVAAGRYAGFDLDRRLAVVGEDRDGVIVAPGGGRGDVVRVTADGASLRELTVAGCRPVRRPAGGLDDEASAAVRLDGVEDVLVERVTVRDGADRAGRFPVGCHGVYLRDTRRSRVARVEVSGSGTGVYVVGGGTGVSVVDSWIHDNDVLIRNDAAPDNDFGATGINFTRVGEEPGPVAEGNLLEDNHGPSADYGRDGAGFEIFQAAHVTMRGNRLRGNDVVLETGASGREYACAGNAFVDNVVEADTADALAKGLLLRCGQDLALVGNRIGALSGPTFSLTPGDAFGSTVAGLRIEDNEVLGGPRQVYLVEGRPTDLAGFRVRGNRYTATGDGVPFATFALPGGGVLDVATLADWQQRTGLDAGSTLAR